MEKILSVLFMIAAIMGCNSSEQKNAKFEDTPKKEVKKVVKAKPVPKTISIYRFGNFSNSTAQELALMLKGYFPNVVLKEKALTLPSEHYNKERNRYLGSGLFEELQKHQNGEAVIGLTDYVIFKPNEISATYGIMGISPVGTYRCVVSSKIPSSGKEHKADNFLKLALHELGHSFGLHHCPDQHCFMVDAEHKMKFPQTTGFCESCKEKLNAKGWTIQ